MGRGPVKHSLAGLFLFYYPPLLRNIQAVLIVRYKNK